MTELKNKTYGIVGLGIMGGSIAKAIRENVLDQPETGGRIFACDISKPSLDMAQSSGIIDKGFLPENADEMLGRCSIVFICLYPHATVDFIKSHKNAFSKGTLVTDISGVKTVIVEGLASLHCPGVDFIIGHPMAGGEKEGYVNSNGAYFTGRNYIIMPRPENKPENIEMMKNLITEMGFTRIVETDYRNHDHKIAFTSQLCHVIASALVKSAEDEHITEFGGGSYEDLTRIAMINAPLWTELFLADKKELLGHIENFEKQINTIKEYIQSDDSEDLNRYLEEVRLKRMKMSRIDTVIKD